MSGYGGVDDESVNAQAFIDNHMDLCRSLLPKGEGTKYCLECGDEIPELRRKALVGVTTCIPCQIEIDKKRPTIKVVTYML